MMYLLEAVWLCKFGMYHMHVGSPWAAALEGRGEVADDMMRRGRGTTALGALVLSTARIGSCPAKDMCPHPVERPLLS